MEKRSWKADEMELAVNLRAMRISHCFTTLALVVYCCITLAKMGDLPTVSFLILCGSNLLFFGVKQALTKRLTKDVDDEE